MAGSRELLVSPSSVSRGRIAVTLLLGAMLLPGAASASGGGGMGGDMGSGSMMPSPSTPQYDAAQEYRDGAAAYKAGKYRDAAMSFDHVTQAAPKEVTGWRMLGLACTAANDAKGAVRAYERALKIDPKAVETRRDYALALAQLKMPDKASAQLDQLKSRAAACNDTCPEAAHLKTAISSVEAALKPAAGAAPGPGA